MKNKVKCIILCPNPSIDIMSRIRGFIPGEPTRIQEERRYPGGKGIHVSMALSELDCAHELWAIWGKSNEGYLKEMILEYYPSLHLRGPSIDGWVRTCYSFIADNEWKDTELLGAGPTCTSADVSSIIDLLENEAAEIAYLAVCGSWPKGSPKRATAEVVKTAKRLGIRTIIDASGVQLEYALKEHPYAIHLNQREACEVTGLKLEDALLHIKEFCSVAAITAGKDGLYYVTDDQIIHAHVKLTREVISTIGSGDCLTAGMMFAMMKNLHAIEISKWDGCLWCSELFASRIGNVALCRCSAFIS